MTIELHGKNIIGKETAGGEATFQAFDPSRGLRLGTLFHEATPSHVDRAMRLAARAFEEYRERPAGEVAAFLDRVGEELFALGDALIQRASAETGLPPERLTGERARTVNQLRMFADLVREGSWVEARIDRAIPDRQPLPKPDIRRMLIPLGPVVVFGASNFPLAFSTAGGDTASALAARNPVVVKAHPAHPGTAEMAARAILKAAEAVGMPEGVFSLLHGAGHEVGLNLVEHPLTRAVGFTGSLKGGRALFDAAARRPDPIPVYAEMGSVNPVFVLPGALKERASAIAEGLKQSVTLGVGQFCTCPGLVVGLEGEPLSRMIESLSGLIEQSAAGTMLTPGILDNYEAGLKRLNEVAGLQAIRSKALTDPAKTEAVAALFIADVSAFLENRSLSQEVFGPAAVVVRCPSRGDMEAVARNLEGHLTATLHGTEEDLKEYGSLIALLETKVGRLIFNGYPTGVEVCPSMHHGGPYPATTDVRSTSVGTAAIQRFARPICYQNFPQSALPAELQDTNTRRIWRLVDNRLTQQDI